MFGLSFARLDCRCCCNAIPLFFLVHPHLWWLSLHVRWCHMPQTRYILPLCLVVISCSFPIFKTWWVLNSPCFMDIGSNRQHCLFFSPWHDMLVPRHQPFYCSTVATAFIAHLLRLGFATMMLGWLAGCEALKCRSVFE